MRVIIFFLNVSNFVTASFGGLSTSAFHGIYLTPLFSKISSYLTSSIKCLNMCSRSFWPIILTLPCLQSERRFLNPSKTMCKAKSFLLWLTIKLASQNLRGTSLQFIVSFRSNKPLSMHKSI